MILGVILKKKVIENAVPCSLDIEIFTTETKLYFVYCDIGANVW